jgi:hypothetical protein
MANIESLTLKELAEIIKHGNTKRDNQLCVMNNGNVELHPVTHPGEVENVRFYLGLFHPEDDLVGVDAAKDDDLIERLLRALNYYWHKGFSGSTDLWRVVPNIK